MIEFRPGDDADKPQILARTAEVFGAGPAQRMEALWDWQWHRDPRLPSPGYRGVIAEWRGRVIGHLATIPAGLHIGGEPVQAWWFVDVLVHWGLTREAMREQRRVDAASQPDLSRGLAAALFDHPIAGPIQLGKHVSDPMSTIGRRIGFVPCPDTGGAQRRISVRHPVGRMLGARLGDLAGAVIDPLLGPNPRSGLSVRIHDGPFDGRFDALWASVRGAFPAICRRDAALLNWRYRDCPDLEARVLILEDDGALRGYCVIRAFDRPGRPPRRLGKILDLLTAPGDRIAQRALLGGAIPALRQLRAERVECFYSGADLWYLLAEFGFAPKTTNSGRARPLLTRHLPEAAKGIYITQGDGDGG